MAFLAYLKHLAGFVAILMTLSAVSPFPVKTGQETTNSVLNTTYTELRESAVTTKPKKKARKKMRRRQLTLITPVNFKNSV